MALVVSAGWHRIALHLHSQSTLFDRLRNRLPQEKLNVIALATLAKAIGISMIAAETRTVFQRTTGLGNKSKSFVQKRSGNPSLTEDQLRAVSERTQVVSMSRSEFRRSKCLPKPSASIPLMREHTTTARRFHPMISLLSIEYRSRSAAGNAYADRRRAFFTCCVSKESSGS
jgi:hypothetical protein